MRVFLLTMMGILTCVMVGGVRVGGIRGALMILAAATCVLIMAMALPAVGQ